MKRKTGFNKLFFAVTSLALVCFFTTPSIAQRKIDKGFSREEKIVVAAPDDPHAEVGIVSIGIGKGVSEGNNIPDNLVAPDDPYAEVGIVSIGPGKEVPEPIFDKYLISPQPSLLFAKPVLIAPASSYSFGRLTSYSPFADLGGYSRTAASFGNSYGNTFNAAPVWSSYPANAFNFGWSGSNSTSSSNLFGFNNSFSISNSSLFGLPSTAAGSNPVDWSRNSFGTYGTSSWSANPFNSSFGPFNYNFSGILAGSNDHTNDIGLANPAATFCKEHGGTYKIITDEDGSQRGVCIYGDGCECPDSLYFKGECQSCEDTTSRPEPVAPRYDGNTGNTGIPNPSAVNCEQNGGIYEIRTAEDGSQNGVCIFSDGTECDAWAFFRGECQSSYEGPEFYGGPEIAPQLGGQTGSVGIGNPASAYCKENGGISEIRTDADGSQYGVCIFSDKTECEEWAYFRGECQP
ncbi:MAG: DUF333 domain-containing protein [bacterium]